MNENNNVSLRDVINYTPDKYLDDHEIEIIRNTFEGERGRQLIKILRKVLLPTLADPELPIENMGQDVWMQGVDFKSMGAEHIKAIVMGRQEAIKFVIGAFIDLKRIANIPQEDPKETAERMKKNSNK